MYKPRIADRLLIRKPTCKGAVLIEGPKWCGKTTPPRQQAKSLLDLGDTEGLKQSRQMMEISPKTLLQGETPRLIDEWQTITELWGTIIRCDYHKQHPYSEDYKILGIGSSSGKRSWLISFFYKHMPIIVSNYNMEGVSAQDDTFIKEINDYLKNKDK